MGYSRSLKAISRHFEHLKQVVAEPEKEHRFEVPTWDQAQRLAYQLREAMYAAQFNLGYEHIAKLKLTHSVRHSSANVVTIQPKYHPDMVKTLKPIPSWATTGNTSTQLICESAKTTIDVIGTLRDLQPDGPWLDIIYPNVAFGKLSAMGRKLLYEATLKDGYWILDLEDGGMSLVQRTQEVVFESIYYTPADEDEYVGLASE